MPWDGTRLVVRDLATGTDVYVAGGEHEAITEPTWQADGSLWFLSDRTGWFGIYRWDPADHATTAIVEIEADIGLPHRSEEHTSELHHSCTSRMPSSA